MENNTEKAETVIDNHDTKLQHKSSKVFYISIAITLVIVAWGLLAQSNFEKVANAAFDFLVGNFGWFYLITMSLFVVYALGLAISRYGNVKLGKPDEDPKYSTISWFAMLFSAGMGVGLVFWGVAEPLSHFVNPLGM
jgi:glycine betaine transporter